MSQTLSKENIRRISVAQGLLCGTHNERFVECGPQIHQASELISALWRDLRHYHAIIPGEMAGENDECRYCGLDLRDEIHFRVGEAD